MKSRRKVARDRRVALSTISTTLSNNSAYLAPEAGP